MVTPENPDEDLTKLAAALGENTASEAGVNRLPAIRSERVCSIRQALFAPHETVSPEMAQGRICGAPTVSCPPAIPIAVSGERISPEMVEWFRHCGVREINVLK
jgi:arginine/lysine/ornithine decarboxylase